MTVLYGAHDHKFAYKEELDTYLRENGPVPGLDFHAVQHPYPWLSRGLEFAHDNGVWLVYYLGYWLWQRAAYREAVRLSSIAPFDIAHQLNMIGFREPGYLWKLGVPFVWGPIGGAAAIPWRYLPSMGARGCLFHAFRNIANRFQMSFGRRCRAAARDAVHLFASTHEDLAMISAWGRSAELMVVSGSEEMPGAQPRTYSGNRPLRISWSGVHEARKALPLLLNALVGLAGKVPFELTVLGAGNLTGSWTRLAERLGLSPHVRWIGRLPRSEAIRVMGQADVFVHTSTNESTPVVLLEALSMGLPVICHDAFGMSLVVTEQCGIKVPMHSPVKSIAGFREAIQRVAISENLLNRLSRGALERAAVFAWERQTTRVTEVYSEVLRARCGYDANAAVELPTKTISPPAGGEGHTLRHSGVMETPRPSILVSAYALSPCRGSEAGVGWNIVSRLGRYYDVTVLFAESDHGLLYRTEVGNYTNQRPLPGVSFVPVPHPRGYTVLKALHDAGIWPVYYFSYARWQKAAYRMAVAMHASHPFALAHQLNMIGFREPGYLWRLPIPFVWGPVGGAFRMPWSFFSCLSWRGRVFHLSRNIIGFVQEQGSQRLRYAARAALHLWAVSSQGSSLLESIGGRTAAYLMETGADGTSEGAQRRYSAGRDLQIAWSGNFDSAKALQLLLHALARIESSSYELLVVGDGKEKRRWVRLSKSLGIADRIRWLGRTTRAEAMSAMRRADVFVFTSLTDGTSSVIMEALEMGLPVVCHDSGGVGRAVTDDCGIRVPLINPSRSVAGFAQALQRLHTEPGLLNRLSGGALRRARELTWDTKVSEIISVYDQILSSDTAQAFKTPSCGQRYSGTSIPASR